MTSLNTGAGPISLGNLGSSFPIPSWELVCKDFKNVKTATHIQKAQVLFKHVTSVTNVVISQGALKMRSATIILVLIAMQNIFDFNMKQFHGPL